MVEELEPEAVEEEKMRSSEEGIVGWRGGQVSVEEM